MSDLSRLLKTKGFRLTKPRKAIVEVLESYPRTALELHSEVTARGISVDLASVYRTLELLQQLEVVQVVDLGEGMKRFELVHDRDHHHHVSCTHCGSIEHISIQEESLLNTISVQSQYQIQNHTIEFFGLCPKCQDHK